MPRPPISLGRICLTVSAVVTSIGTYAADWSETHVLNPRWPPHAKFHNGQSMSLGLALGILTVYYTWRPTAQPKDSLRTAAILASLYYVTGLSGILYPGALGVDPEFGEGFPQFWLFTAFTGLPWLGYLLESRRLRR
ncbi:hypothetical protein HO133_006814 [Letharia lupina]|uniref:Uncharacterized protein n=1 Tax=Letharia lupina TaxID=560253 RepID=A0A8H6F6Z9_9LECA|nr:uncharacterized protein HO133_006814 [Letharia lupina]KAF6217476.1 hypothetical protein HO133_006814 [Letharia lupina]